jgi:magnesium-transporting ATPase (P-type)
MPVDGVITEGSCAVDESMLTGESRLVAKAPGSSVTGGTVNYEGPVTVRATSTGQASTLAGGQGSAGGPAGRRAVQSGAQPLRVPLLIARGPVVRGRPCVAAASSYVTSAAVQANAGR